MAQKMKAIGLAFVAVFAMAAVAASAAHAATGKVTAASYPAALTGDQDGGTTKFVIGKEIRTVTCAETLYEATITGPSESVTVIPHYGGCLSAPGASPVDINTHHCTYTLSVPNVAENKLTAAVTTCPLITNPETGHGPITIQITDANKNVVCDYQVTEQNNLLGSTWVNKAGPPEDITLEINVAPVTKVTVGTAIACGAAAGNNVAATLKGASTVKAFKDIEGSKEGEQIGVMIG